jgi:hypothetical protein
LSDSIADGRAGVNPAEGDQGMVTLNLISASDLRP